MPDFADSHWRALASAEIRYAIKLSLISSSLTTLLSLWVAVPLGYLLSRHRFPGRGLVDALVDIVGACAGLEALGVGRVCASELPLGGGTVMCEHGRIPVPAPATLR